MAACPTDWRENEKGRPLVVGDGGGKGRQSASERENRGENRDPRAFNPRKRNSSWIHFERKRAFRGAQRIGVLFTLTWWGRGVMKGERRCIEGGGEMASGWLTGRREDCREFDHAIKGWQRWFARVGRARLPTPFSRCLFLSFFLFSGWKARDRTKTKGCRHANRSGWLYIFTRLFVSRGPCCAVRSLRRKLLIRRYNDGREPFDRSTMRSILFIADAKAWHPWWLRVPRLRNYSNSLRQSWWLNLESLGGKWVRIS